MTIITYAQNFEDVILQRVFKGVECGFYVDVGANHPSTDSVTKAFYDRGWRGINIEPVAGWYQMLQKERPHDLNLQLVVTDEAGLSPLFEVEDTGLSTIYREAADAFSLSHGFNLHERLMPCLTLTQILNGIRAPEIHFIKIDVEQAEAAVLRGLDLNRLRPWVIVVEATEPLSQVESYQDWEPQLLDCRYKYVYSDGLNRFYLANEHSELEPDFRYPPNVFDEIVPGKLCELHHAIVELLEGNGLGPLVADSNRMPSNATEYFASIFANLSKVQSSQTAQRDEQANRTAAADKRIDELESEVHNAWTVAAAFEQKLIEIRRGASWKLTAPVREAGRVGQRLHAFFRRLIVDTGPGAHRESVVRRGLRNLERSVRRFRKHGTVSAETSTGSGQQKAIKPLSDRAQKIHQDLLQALKQNKAA